MEQEAEKQKTCMNCRHYKQHYIPNNITKAEKRKILPKLADFERIWLSKKKNGKKQSGRY